MTSYLEFHVFGGAKGESIAVGFPAAVDGDFEWGVIDCYSPSGEDSIGHPISHFLKSRGVKQLAFLSLTHPHDDHFHGMSCLVDDFIPKVFVRFPCSTSEDMRLILSYELQNGNNELFNLFAKIKSRRKTAPRIELQYAQMGARAFPLIENANATFRMTCLAPSSNSIEKYYASLKRCFDDKGKLRANADQRCHNTVSSAFLIEFGNARIVCGGDVERSGWKNCLEQYPSMVENVDLVKVSHHGSTNGYCEGLWRIFSQKKKVVSIIAPFRRHALPTKECLDHISQFSKQVIVIDPPPTGQSPSAPPSSRMALSKKFRNANWHSSDHRTRIKRVGIKVDPLGNIFDYSEDVYPA